MRGAPAIGVAAAYGYALAAERGEDLDAAYRVLAESRPTAVNLVWALEQMRGRPVRRAGSRPARGRGRPLQAHGSACSRPLRAGHEGVDALQRRRARDGRLRLGRRGAACGVGGGPVGACVGRRDAAAAPGGEVDGLGARSARCSARRDRRLGGRASDEPRRGRLHRHRSRPDRRQRRLRKQDRDVWSRRGRCPSPDPALCRRADLDDRSCDGDRSGDPDRGARRRRDHQPLRGPQPRLRRHSGRADRGDRDGGRRAPRRRTGSRCRDERASTRSRGKSRPIRLPSA